MKMLATFASLAVAASFAAPASAQTYSETIYDLRDGTTVQRVSDINDPRYGALPPFEVMTIVRSMGFEPQSQPVLRGPVYVVRAFDDQDVPVRVAVDARSGRVVNVVERGAGRFGQVVDEERYGGGYPVPPRAVPYGSVYREPEYGGPIYRGSDATTYSPAPYAPSVAPRAAAPRVASRAPAAAPTPRAKPETRAVTAAPAKPAATASIPAPTAPQGAAPAARPTATTSALIQDAGRPGVSIPAPVARKPAEATAAKPVQPEASSPKPDTTLVPVAPLE